MRHFVLAIAVTATLGASSKATAESAVAGADYTSPQAVSTAAGTSATLSAKKVVIAPPKDYKAFPVEALGLPFELINHANREVGRALMRLQKNGGAQSAGSQEKIPLEVKILSQIHEQGNPPPGETPEQIEEITRDTDRKLKEMQLRSRQQESEVKEAELEQQ